MTWKANRLTELLEIKVPIVQAPMAGCSTSKMAAEASNAGALGSLGCAMQSVSQVAHDVVNFKTLSKGSFNLNFFAHKAPEIDPQKISVALQTLEPWYSRLEAGEIVSPNEISKPFDAAMCEAVVAAKPKVVSFHFGLPSSDLVKQLKNAGIVIMSSATSVAEANWLENRGADVIIAQGHEAGGHSGWFLDREGSDVAGTLALVPRIVDAVSVPVIAAGGIADGRGIAAAMVLGADGVQLGTAFVATHESSVSQIYKEEIVKASGDDTVLSKAFSGRNARTIMNVFASETADVKEWPDFPLMNAATAPLRSASAQSGLPDAVSLWSGQGVGLIKSEASVQDVIERLIEQVDGLLT